MQSLLSKDTVFRTALYLEMVRYMRYSFTPSFCPEAIYDQRRYKYGSQRLGSKELEYELEEVKAGEIRS